MLRIGGIMNDIEEKFFRLLMLPMFVISSVGVVMLANSWGRWAVFGDNLYVTAYYKNRYPTPFDVVCAGSAIEIIAGSFLVLAYIYCLWIYIKPAFKHKDT
jgi:hypothetical protein